MRASIIITAYNSRADLGACLDSVLREVRPDDEVIVVDNDSSDGSADVVATGYPQVRLIHNANTGYAGGNNRGAAAAQGAYLFFLNPDTVLQPGALDALLKPLQQPDAVALTTARVVHLRRPQIINTCGNTMHYTGLTYCRGADQPAERFGESGDVDAVSGAAFAMRRAVFEQLGGFDESFFMYVEDSDLSLRARLAGYRCWYAADAVVLHDYAFSYSPNKAFYLERNRHLMLLKNLRRGTYLRMLPGLALGEVVTWGFLLLNGPRFWTVKPRVYAALWRARGSIRASRQASSASDDRALVGHMTYRLEFGQIAHQVLARAAEAVFHPAFWAARLLFAGGRS